MSMRMVEAHILADEAQTRALGAALAAVVRPGDVIALRGGLGVGKTTFSRGLIQALLGTDEDVPSPTYTLVQAYESAAFPVWHFDLYRLESPDELPELGWDETAEGVVLVEWPEHAGTKLPERRLDLTLDFDGSKRVARLEPKGEDWQTRLDGLRF